MADLKTRRVVTGHSADGKAIFLSDESLTALDLFTGEPLSGNSPGVTTIDKTAGLPARLNEPFLDYHGKYLPIVDESGAFCRVLHLPPIPSSEAGNPNFVHRTQSIDFGIVLEGQVQLILDDDNTKTLRKGDVVVQRGTVHDWKNLSEEYCKMLFVLLPSDKPKVETTGEVLEPLLPSMS